MKRMSEKGVSLLAATLYLANALAAPTFAQAITPALDGTGTVVNSVGNTSNIAGGSLSSDGNNLFHSFNSFGLSQGQIADFQTSANIQNILGRVVGGDPSFINGLVQVTGSNANLFLLNPAGIVFGPNARLDLTGAFTATTANGVQFGSNYFNAAESNNYAALIGSPSALAFTVNQPGSIVNSGLLSVRQGQDLNLVGGTVVSTGQLSGGQVHVASVPGNSLVRIGQPNHLLSLEVQPPASTQPNTWSLPVLSLPQLLGAAGGSNATGLTVNPDGTVQLTGSGLEVKAGDVVVKDVDAQTATLSANQNLTLGESHLHTTGDLNLLAEDTVQVRDSVEKPFLAQSEKNLYVQGHRSIDILALNHPGIPFQAGGALSLVSDGNISGDAHFASGEEFSIRKLDGSPGNFISLHDPIISSNGDVTFGDYTGVSLKVESKGSITGGNINITGADVYTSFSGSDPDIAILRNGPAVVLRAGLDKLANSPNYISSSSGGFASTNNIDIGSINISNFNFAEGTIILDSTGGEIVNPYVGSVLKSGPIGLGIFGKGNLGFSNTGLRLDGVETGDAVTPGCLCEGWGFAGDGIAGGASAANSSPGNLKLTSFTATPSSVTSVASLRSLPSLKITQTYAPSKEAPTELFEGKVTIENTGSDTISDIRYTRAVDWDIPPTVFNEYVTIGGRVGAKNVLYSSDNGFASVNPLEPKGFIDPATVNTDFVDSGPNDHGAVFDFGFGDLAGGASSKFSIFYGGTTNETKALAALSSVKAEVYSLGQASGRDYWSGIERQIDGKPGTFIFGFKPTYVTAATPEQISLTQRFDVLPLGSPSLSPSSFGRQSQLLSALYPTVNSYSFAGQQAGELPRVPIVSPFNSSVGSYFIGFNTNYRFASPGPSSNFEDPSYSYGFGNFSTPTLYPGFVNMGFYSSNTRPIANGIFVTRRMGTGIGSDFVGRATSLGSELTSFGTDFKDSSSSSSGPLFAKTAQAGVDDKPKQLVGGISNTEEPSTRSGKSSFGGSSSSSGNTTLSVNPDAQLKNDPHWGNIVDYFPAPDQTSGISWNDPYRTSGFQKALNIYGAFSKGIVDFATGFNDGFRSSIFLGYDPNYVPTNSTAYNFGRPAGDVAAGILGIAEFIGGSGLGGGGLAACGTVLCPAGAPAIVGGAALAGYGYGTLKTASEAFSTDFTNLFAQENEGTGSAQTGAQGEADSSGGTGSGGAPKGGAARAAQYSANWESSSLQSALNKFAPGAKGTVSGQKTIYTNPETGIEVVFDNAGNYFRIQNTNLTGKRSYLDLNGNIPNNKIVDGKQLGRSQAEYNQVTHFSNAD
jgi:filamentous hemagglutinin family protein